MIEITRINRTLALSKGCTLSMFVGLNVMVLAVFQHLLALEGQDISAEQVFLEKVDQFVTEIMESDRYNSRRVPTPESEDEHLEQHAGAIADWMVETYAR